MSVLGEFAARLTASMSLTRTKMLLANTNSKDMMLNARTALRPRKKSTMELEPRTRSRGAKYTHMREEEALWRLANVAFGKYVKSAFGIL